MKSIRTSYGLLLAILFACHKPDPTLIRIKGSESLYETVRALARDYNALQDTAIVEVEGGGSRTGLMGVIHQDADLGMSSFDFALDSLFGADHGIAIHTLAVDGIVLLHHSGNTIVNLDTDQVKKLYTGAILNWSELGGPDVTVLPIVRDSNSGTQQFFEQYFHLNTNEIKATVAQDNSDIVKLIRDSAGGIGFVGFAYFTRELKDVHLPSTSPLDSVYIAPTPPNLRNNKYPLKRNLMLYYNQADRDKISGFLKYTMTDRAQAIIESFGLLPS